MIEHPLEEWERLKEIPLPETYDNNKNLRFTKCTCTFTGYKGQKLKLVKSKTGVSIKFAEWLDKDEAREMKKTKRHWAWLQQKITDEEAKMLGRWLIGGPDEE